MLLLEGSDISIVSVDGFSSILGNISGRLPLDKSISLNSILIGNKYVEYFGNGGWYDVEFKMEYDETTSGEKSIHRIMQVICFPVFKSDKVILSEDDLFNVLKSEYLQHEIPYLQVKGLRFDPISLNSIPKAREIKLCSIKTFLDEDVQVIDALLKLYFGTTKYLYEGDLFSMDGTKYLPELMLKKRKNYSSRFHFLVCDVIDMTENESFCLQTGRLVNYSVTMYQITSRNSFLPPKINLFIGHTFDAQLPSNKWIHNLVPSSLKTYFQELKTTFRPFLSHNMKDIDLDALFFISGVKGCGKSLLLEGIAGHLGLNYEKICCHRLLNGTVTRYNEARLKELFNRIEVNCPCLLQLDNFEALGHGSDGSADVRLVGTFKKLLKGLGRAPFPIIIVGTTSDNIENIPSNLSQLIIHNINIIPVNGNNLEAITERRETIEWLCFLNHPLIDLDPLLSKEIAHSTSGFTLKDLSLVLHFGLRNTYVGCEEINHETFSKSSPLDNFAKIIDQMNIESGEDVGAPKVPRVNWADVGGHNEIKKEIIRSIDGFGFGSEIKRSGLLLWGPPGTGKTLLAKAVATECGSSFLSVKGPELLNKYIGQSEENVRKMFEKARQSAPCIIFFDELDSLAPNRGKSGDSGGVMDRVVSQLLSEMDGLQSNERVFVLGATNRPDLIDAALLRPGRLDKMLYVGPCEDLESKIKVLEALTRRFRLTSCVNLKEIAGTLPSQLTGADLYSVCYGAWQNSAKNFIKNNDLDVKNTCSDISNVIIELTADDFLSAIHQFEPNS